jgi:hypothetical protein
MERNKKKEEKMKKNGLLWLLTALCFVGLTGCCAQLRPQKVVFTPELDLAIKAKIAEYGFESPMVLLIGDNGQTFALGVDGKTFTPCRAPEPEELQLDDTGQMAKGKQQSPANKENRKTASALPICEGMKDIKGIFPVESITIMTVRKNPIYRLVRTGSGRLEEQCIPVPGEDQRVCD